jgi:hypothetical protein
MMTISNIFQAFSPEYLYQFGKKIPSNHKKVIRAINDCRTEKCGTSIYECQQCGKQHRILRSCGNRHCPICQNHKTRQWVEKQLKNQLPGHHFMITFTVPEKIRRFIRKNQRLCYSALFKASSDAMKKLAADDKYMGGDSPGFFGVLHTWGRMIQYHPHIHYIAPGGAISKHDGKWHPSRVDFFLPVKALSKLFKVKFKDEMKKANLFNSIPDDVWDQKWIVNCQPVGNSEHSIKYLSRYVFKVAITNSRILKIEDRKVFFKYKKPRSHRWRITKLDVMEFMRRFLQHVLPTGFMKVRYYGFMHPTSSVKIDELPSRIELAYGFNIDIPAKVLEPLPPLTCSTCGGNLKYIGSFLPCKIISTASG